MKTIAKKTNTVATKNAKATKATPTKPTEMTATVTKPTAKDKDARFKKVDRGLFALVARK